MSRRPQLDGPQLDEPQLDDGAADARAWADSGAMALTGRPDGPPLVGGLAALRLRRLADDIEARTAGSSGAGAGGTGAGGARTEGGVRIDWASMISGRAALLGLHRRGRTSANGSCRLLRATDGWIAMSLARTTDWDSVDALISGDGDATARSHPRGDVSSGWAAVEAFVAGGTADRAVAQARLLGLPAAPLRAPSESAAPALISRPWSPATVRPVAGLRVVDLSSMWAGPLTARILLAAGADVVKVESSRRRDGARSTPAFYHWLHPPEASSVSIDFGCDRGRAELRHLIQEADIVIEASRPRALEQLGAGPETCGDRPGRIWLSITGYGRRPPGRDWVAFGDDAAVAGGLVAWDEDRRPTFCADAIADPVTGLLGASLVLRSLAGGGGHLIDLALSRAAAAVAVRDRWGRPSPFAARPAPGKGWELPVDGAVVAVREPSAPAALSW